MSIKKKVPGYYFFRIFLSSLIIYTLLVMPFVMVIAVRAVPQIISLVSASLDKPTPGENRAETFRKRLKELDAEHSAEEEELGNIIVHFPRTLLFLAILLLAFNIPFKVFFFLKKFNLKIPGKLETYCRRILLKSPLINVLIILIPIAISHGIFFHEILQAGNTQIEHFVIKTMTQLLSISLISSLLTCLFIFLWLKYRVQQKYMEHVFDEETLHKRIFKKKPEKIRRALESSAMMTTFMPMLVILTYVFLNVTYGQNIRTYSDDQIRLLTGRYIELIELMDESDKEFTAHVENPNFTIPYFYINMVDTFLMFFGIFSGVIISIIYIVFFVGWTTNSIVDPIRELLKNMRKTGAGKLEQYTIVRSNNEIGELTEGFNLMSRQISNHIENIQNISESYYRFVPKQFIQYLGKEDLTQVSLGDQVQKEMTILFSDIRSFTTLSEQMTPEENFNFINTFFGFMEPAISENGGFIDKYIGDAIMALFPGSADDAIRAAIQMRQRLAEFNSERIGQSLPAINTGIGIHTGTLMLGIVGGPNRMEGTVISDAVNLASRLEDLTKLYGASIIISIQTLYKLEDAEKYAYQLLDDVKVKGRKQAVSIYEILDGEAEDVKDLKQKAYEHIEKGIYNYRGKRFKRALTNFKKAQTIFPAYKVSSTYIQRCEKVLDAGVPDDWSPIIYLDEKS